MRYQAFKGDLLDHLRTFVAVATYTRDGAGRGMERAAEACCVDSSTLRRRLGTLRTWANDDALIEGSGRNRELTPTGELLHATATRILGELRLLELRALAESSRVVIGCGTTIATDLLPAVVRRAREATPDLEVCIRRANLEQAAAMLLRGDIHIAIVRAGEAPEPPLEGERLVHDRVAAAVPRGHPLARITTPTLDKLARYPLVTFPPGSPTRARVDAVLGRHAPSVQIEVDSKAALLAYVESSESAIALLAHLPGADLGRRYAVETVDVTAHFPRSAFWLVWHAGRPPREVARSVASTVRAEVRRRTRGR